MALAKLERLFTGPVDANGLPTTYDPSWQAFTNLTAAQESWFRSQPQWLTFYVGQRRWQKQISGISINGLPIDTNENSYGLLAGLAIRAMRDQTSSPAATYYYTDNGVVASLTIAQALDIFDAVSGYIQACRSTEARVLAGIKGGAINSQAQIDAALAAIPTIF